MSDNDKMATASSTDYNVSQLDRLKRKAKEAPFVPIGIAAMLGTLGWAGYSYKNRGRMSTSVFLMHTRVKAQGMIVGALALGVGYSLFSDYVVHKDEHPLPSFHHEHDHHHDHHHKKDQHVNHEGHFNQPHHPKHHNKYDSSYKKNE